MLDILQKKPSLQIRISGHTDNIGDASYNQELSQARAQAVVDYLLEKGIKTERLSASGFGQSLPIADNNTEEGRQLNRRVELTVVSATE